jgi:hypothetical protein
MTLLGSSISTATSSLPRVATVSPSPPRFWIVGKSINIKAQTVPNTYRGMNRRR